MMKNVYLIIVFIFSFSSTMVCLSKTENNYYNDQLEGIWIFEVFDVPKMCTFLGISKQDTTNYCMKIEKDKDKKGSYTGKIYFVTYDKILDVKIMKLRDNKYTLVYKNKSRPFIVNQREGDKLFGIYYLDSCEKQINNVDSDCIRNGYKSINDISDESLKETLDWIKKEDSLPDAPPPF